VGVGRESSRRSLRGSGGCIGGGTRRFGGLGGSDASTRVSLAGIEGSGSTGPSWREAFRFFLYLSCAARHPMQLANTLLARPAEGSFRKEEIGRFWTHAEQYFASMAAAAGAGEAEEDTQTGRPSTYLGVLGYQYQHHSDRH
jgi:hypothetical protein